MCLFFNIIQKSKIYFLEFLENNFSNEDWSSVKLEEPDDFRGELESTISRIIKSKSGQHVKPAEVCFFFLIFALS